MSTLLESVQKHLASALEGGDFVIFGENVNNGSRLSGLGKNLDKLSGVKVLNVGNCELTHVGVGMGLMIAGGKALLLVKQLDFLLLGLDQMVNTLNWVRANAGNRSTPLGSFTILTYLCDQGYQGPQSSMVDLNGFCSLGGFPGFILQEDQQIEALLKRELGAPGFRLIGIPQKMATQAVESEEATLVDDVNGVRLYGDLSDACIISCHSSFSAALSLRKQLRAQGKQACILLSSIAQGADPSLVFKPEQPPKQVLILDDAKGLIKWGDSVARQLLTRFPEIQVQCAGRPNAAKTSVHPDETFDCKALALQFASS